MHISDGVLPGPIWIGSYVASGLLVASGLRRMKADDVPKTAIMTSAFFVASLIHVPLGPTSAHLLLIGLVGIIIQDAAFVSVFLALVLQALLFGYGGITTVGVNSIMMGLPALGAYRLYRFSGRLGVLPFVSSAIAGGGAVLAATVLLSAFLISAGEEFFAVSWYAAVAHLPVILIEAAATGFIISFIQKVKPELLRTEGL